MHTFITITILFQEINALKHSSGLEDLNSSRSQHMRMLEDNDVLVDKIRDIIRSEMKEEKKQLDAYVANEVDKMISKTLADIDGIKTALNIQIGVMKERTVSEMRVLVSKRLEDVDLETRKTSAAVNMSVQAALDKLDDHGKRMSLKLEDELNVAKTNVLNHVQSLNLNFSSNIENLLVRTDSTLTTFTRAFAKQKIMMNNVSADIARKSALLENDVRQAVSEMKEHMENKTLEIEQVQYIATTNLTSFIKNASSLIDQKVNVMDEKEVQLNQSATDAIVALRFSQEATSEFVLSLERKLFENTTEILNQTNQNSNNTLMELITQFETLSDNLNDRVNVSLSNVVNTLETINTSVHYKIETQFGTLENNVNAKLSRSESVLGGRISSNRQYTDSSKSSLQSSISSLQSSISSVRSSISSAQSSISSVRSSVNSAKTNIDKMKVIMRLPGMHLTSVYYPYREDVFDWYFRLTNPSPYGSYGIQGILGVGYNGEWGTVCDDGFSGTQGQYNLNVLVKQFNFIHGEYVTSAGMGEGSGTILMDDVECKSDSTDFRSCDHRGWGKHNCGHHEDLGLKLWS
ncbi:uncharacterized protein LOC128222444 isoform X2 [Mya arenaria]|uniref:uncharacterized protein LOC128222444 isoform X2 n=1 Tax=Mya arenaria TaxID=6604 RepID=UPI0022E5292F|nr:uncharacterized protein LOC128222444 isoform X2 [Mya arenaria]XP_052787410.1 uncharacterized protein LOC128222444 isoform X2 [Mya arenaria]